MAPQDEDSIFLRHRHGSPLLIKPDIKSKVSDLLQQLRENDDHNAVFRAAINDIQDGNGRGIHPESTWANATILQLLTLDFLILSFGGVEE